MRGKTQHDEGRRNRPIATLIEWYTDKKSGKVSDARQEIKRRFGGLDWSQQKKVLRAFVEGSNEDRRWALRKMYLMWDKSFADIVARHWSQSHDNDCRGSSYVFDESQSWWSSIFTQAVTAKVTRQNAMTIQKKFW